MALLGAVFMTVGVFSSPVAAEVDTQNVPLHNDEAGGEFDCPDDENDYWHFIIAPNNGTYAFETITLNLGDATVEFTGADIIPNGTQLDNVFVQVPADSSLGSLVTDGSSADITPATGSPRFVLSHLCDGEGTTTTTTSTTSTTTSTTSTTTSTTSTTTTLPCEWNPQLPPDHPDCVEPTTTTSTTTTSTTSTTSTTTTTTLPCEWNPELPPGSDQCVPDLDLAALCFDLDNEGDVERYWHRLINNEAVDIDVTWADGAATIPGNGSVLVSSANEIITLSVDGKAAATTPAPSEEFCQNSIEITKIVEGPGEEGRAYTIQISRLVDGEYIQEGDTFELLGGETKTIPLPSTFNEEGVNYLITEIDNGGANNTSVTPDSFNFNGHKGETISVVVQNDFAAISIEKTVDATSISPGQELRYTLVAENTGALDLSPVVIYDRLPAEVIYQAYSIVGGAPAGSCTLEQATRPQLVRCDLTGTFAPGDFTPAIELLVLVDPNLNSTNPILNQAQSIGSYDGEPISPITLSFNGAVGEGRSFIQSEDGDLSCEPTEGQVCDLSAKVGVGVTVETTTTVEQSPPTTVGTGSDSPTTLPPELPKTGADSTQMMVVLGALLVLLGAIMMLGTRRPELVA